MFGVSGVIGLVLVSERLLPARSEFTNQLRYTHGLSDALGTVNSPCESTISISYHPKSLYTYGRDML